MRTKPCACGCGNRVEDRPGRVGLKRGHSLERIGLWFDLGKGRWKVSTRISNKHEYWSRIVAANALGRELASDEHVHHVNLDEANDKNSNLLVCTESYHKFLHGKIRGGLNGRQYF